MKIFRTILSAFVGVPIALLYGLLVRLTFASNKPFSLLLSTMTCGIVLSSRLQLGRADGSHPLVSKTFCDEGVQAYVTAPRS